MKAYEQMSARENLGWCKPFYASSEGRDIWYAVNEGKICGVQVDGEDRYDLTPSWNTSEQSREAMLVALAKLLGIEEDDLGWDVLYEIEGRSEECGCSECPFRDVCEAMEEE